MLKNKFEQRGDTIVEVLIAMVIIGVILLGAAVIANHSSQTEQNSQDRSAATQLLQNQLEELRYYIDNNVTPALPTATTSYFCFSGNAYVNEPSLHADSSYNPVNYPVPCNLGSSGSPTAVAPEFSISIQTDGNTNPTYTVQANWYADGGGIDNASLSYRP